VEFSPNSSVYALTALTVELREIYKFACVKLLKCEKEVGNVFTGLTFSLLSKFFLVFNCVKDAPGDTDRPGQCSVVAIRKTQCFIFAEMPSGFRNITMFYWRSDGLGDSCFEFWNKRRPEMGLGEL